MKKFFWLSWIFLFLPAIVFAQENFNDPNAELREAKNFHAFSVSNAFDVFLSQGNEEAVAVSAAEDKYRDRIRVEVKNGVLHIFLDNEKKFWGNWKGDKKLKAYVSFKTLDAIRVSGACNLHVQGTIAGDNLTVNLSGASDWKEGKINVKKLSADLSGASRMKVTGTALELKVEASGASDFRGNDFTADYCAVNASGASNINITVNKELSGHASGASKVHYKGEGIKKDVRTSGASNILKRS